MGKSREDDLLTGWAGIAAHIGCTPRQAQHRAAIGDLPTFTMGGRIVYARKSTLAKFFAEKEPARFSKGKDASIQTLIFELSERLSRVEAALRIKSHG